MNWGDLYLTGAFMTACVSFVVGMVIAVVQADDVEEYVLFPLMATLAPVVLGFCWPAAVFALAIAIPTKGIPAFLERRAAARASRAHAEARRKREEAAREPDERRYQRIAREQRDLAEQARRNGQPEMADMHDLLAKQNEQLAGLYGEAK